MDIRVSELHRQQCKLPYVYKYRLNKLKKKKFIMNQLILMTLTFDPVTFESTFSGM